MKYTIYYRVHGYVDIEVKDSIDNYIVPWTFGNLSDDLLKKNLNISSTTIEGIYKTDTDGKRSRVV